MKYFLILFCVYSLSTGSAGQVCEKEIYGTKFYTLSTKSNLVDDDVLAIWYPARVGSHRAVHMCSKNAGLPIERYCSFNSISANWDAVDQGMELIDCSVITNNCMEENFEHYYLMKNKVEQKHTNKWPKGRIGEVAQSQEPCLDEKGLPLTRKCNYNTKHFMAEWEKKELKNIKCLQEIKQNIVTNDLSKLYYEVKGNESWTNISGVATKLTNLLAKANTVRTPTDLDISTNILQMITQNRKEPALVSEVLEVTNLLMKSNENVVVSSSALGTPNSLVETVETYLDAMTNVVMPTSKCTAIPKGVKYDAQNCTSVFFINPACSNISGIAVYSSLAHSEAAMHYDSPTNTYIRYLYLNQTLEDFVYDPSLEAATYFPERLWNKLTNEAMGNSNIEAVRISLYRNGNFFVDQENYENTPASIILKIAIPDYIGDLPDYVPLFFKLHHKYMAETPQCGYYNTKTWTTSSSLHMHVQDVALCSSKRLSFGALLGIRHKSSINTDSALLETLIDTTLDFISIAGCILSLFGLLCIWFTAACCKQWRSQSSNKLLLNISFVLTLIMVYFIFIYMPDIRSAVIDMNNWNHCIAEGAFLQYIILVLFMWMLIIATLQYQRYVTVFGVSRPTNAIFKYAVAAWGLPLIPTAMVILLDANSYGPFSGKDAICYPSGSSLYFAVLLPISVIMVVNLGIFFYILCSVRRSLKKFKHAQDRKDFMTQVRLSILLFFILGISWVFGILAHMDDSKVLSFLFCLTSTLQGFILFIYFVVYDQSVRYSWLRCCCGGKDYYTLESNYGTGLTSLSSQQGTK